MSHRLNAFLVLSVLLLRWLVISAQEQNYFFTAPQDPFQQNYQASQNQYVSTQEVSPFRKTQPNFGGFVPQGDLDTSDLPPHLQRTLPQYHLGFLENNGNSYKFQIQPTNQNVPLSHFTNQPTKFTQQISPSTHRPSYSHLFAKNSHNHDPSQTETFLGEITIQSPAELPVEFQNRAVSGFQPSLNFPIQKPHNLEEQTSPKSRSNVSKPNNAISSNKFLKPPPIVDQHLDYTEKPITNNIQFGTATRASFLNHRTRIFAPESKKKGRAQVNDYFVNNNGDVFITTRKNNFSPKPTTPIIPITTLKRKNLFSPSVPRTHKVEVTSSAPNSATTLDTRTVENTFNLDSLLEEPLDMSEHASNKDNVEVIQSVTVSPDKFYLPNINSTDEEEEIEYTTVSNDEFEGEDYDYYNTDSYEEETTLSESNEVTTEATDMNIIQNSEEEKNNTTEVDNTRYRMLNEETNDEEPTTLTTTDSNYEVLTMKPSVMVADNNFKEFVDTTILDSTTDETTTIINIPLNTSETDNTNNTTDINDGNEVENNNEDSISFKDPVISVVTTKSVINNTVIGTLPENPEVTRDMSSSSTPSTIPNNYMMEKLLLSNNATDEENSTEGWVVVASVQTSRSVSGARYLPFPVVEQHEETKPLVDLPESNTKTKIDNDSYNVTEKPPTEEFSTLLPVEKQNLSTESLNDKLDRVQSDLSSGLLTGGFNNGVNNIAVITEGILDKGDETTMFDSPVTMNSTTVKTTTSTTTTRRPSPPTPPPVVIRKFSPHSRPTTTARNKPNLQPGFKPRQHSTRKMNSPFDMERPQGDQPIKPSGESNHKNITTGRSSGISNKNKVIVQDVNQPSEPEISQKTVENLLSKIKFQDTSAFLPPGYKPSDNESQPKQGDLSSLLPPGYKPPSDKPITDEQNKNNNSDPLTSLFEKGKQDNISDLLPPGYKSKSKDTRAPPTKPDISSILKKSKQDDFSALLPPGYKPPQDNKTTHKSDDGHIFKKAKQDDISALLPPGYKPLSNENINKSDVLNSFKKVKQDDIAALLPPGYKFGKSTTQKPKDADKILAHAKPMDDISALLPPGFKTSQSTKSPIDAILSKAHQDDFGALLPPGYKAPKQPSTTEKPKSVGDLFDNAKQDDIAALLPPGYKSRFSPSKTTASTTTTTENVPIESPISTTTPNSGFKVVFPSRPGGARKAARVTTPKSSNDGSLPKIHKGWPSRATTEFTGWPTPSTTPISIEKLLEQARAAAATTSTTTTTTTTTPKSTTTVTTTTTEPTTPGICTTECDLAGTIKLVGGAKWAPELLDRNTKEWQILANEVQYQLEDIYSKSDVLNKWYKKIRIDGFSEGSVLVDYLVELNNVSTQIDTRELKSLFNDALKDAFAKSLTNREPKASDIGSAEKENGKLTLGNFVIDPTYTDFVVLPKQMSPTVGYAEDNVLLPQWAIAIIVIGLASLLFVIIFGVTVLVNKQKNAKKKQPSTLTEEMLNELNKNHMGGIDNYGAEDLYNMEDVWNDKPYETKLPKKRSAGSLHDNSMPNIYDSWRSEWNGYYYNTYYGNHPGSSHSGYGRRRSDYDTNF